MKNSILCCILVLLNPLGTTFMLISLSTITIFQGQSDPKVFAPGEIIFAEEQPGDSMYGILEGEVEILVNGKIVETIKTDEVFGTGILVGKKKRTYTAIAKTDCKLAFLNEQGFLFAVQETPMFAIQVMKSYTERLSRLQHLV